MFLKEDTDLGFGFGGFSRVQGGGCQFDLYGRHVGMKFAKGLETFKRCFGLSGLAQQVRAQHTSAQRVLRFKRGG